MHEYTKRYINEVLFENKESIKITSSPLWISEFLDWSNEENDNIKRKMHKEKYGFEVLQGKEKVEGELLGGCFDVSQCLLGQVFGHQKMNGKVKSFFLKPVKMKYHLTILNII